MASTEISTPDGTMGSVADAIDKVMESVAAYDGSVARLGELDVAKQGALAAIEEIMKQRELDARMEEISNAHATISNNITHGDGNLSFTMYAGNRIAELKAEREALKGETDGR